MKYFVIFVLVPIGFFALWGLGIAVGLFTVPWHSAQNIVDTKHDVIDKTVNADNAIYNYEWFKQRYEDIQANKAKIAIADKAVLDFEASAGARSAWDFQDKQEASRLRAITQGLRSHQEQIIADYNARSKMANRNIFINGIVPDFIDVHTMVGGFNLGGQNE